MHSGNYCHKCGHNFSELKNKSESEVQSNELSSSVQNSNEQEDKQNPNKNGNKTLDSLKKFFVGIAVVIIFVSTMAVARMFWAQTLGLYLIFGSSYYIAKYIAKWSLRKKILGPKVQKFIGWSNIITWFIPPVGIFTATMTLTIIEGIPTQQNKKFRILSWICICLAVVNGIIGVWQRMQ